MQQIYLLQYFTMAWQKMATSRFFTEYTFESVLIFQEKSVSHNQENMHYGKIQYLRYYKLLLHNFII